MEGLVRELGPDVQGGREKGSGLWDGDDAQKGVFVWASRRGGR